MTNVSELGEFGLIDQIRKQVCLSHSVIQGIGDDTAVVDCGRGLLQLLTTDMLVEGVHFTQKMPAESIGHKALACSISDVAAMGGKPLYALISLGCPLKIKKQFMLDLYKGMQKTAKKFGVNIVGGDTVKSEKIIINVALTGQIKKKDVVLRSGAKEGDFIFVTGPLGNSFNSGHHLTFTPRIKESQYLIKHFKPTSMIDISDGLAADLGHILKASKVGAVLNEVDIPRREKASLKQALNDGEDFELLFTLSPKDAKKVKFCSIGKITKTKNRLRILDSKGKEKNILTKGFVHF